MKKLILPGIVALCLISVTVMIIALNTGGKQKFVPPEFDKTAESGTPTPPENLGYTKVYKEGMSFSASICGVIIEKSGKCDVYFTSDSENTNLLKLRILDENDNIIGETGVIKPGEYVKSVKLKNPPKNGSEISLKIMSYVKDTYYSDGSVSLKTALQRGE